MRHENIVRILGVCLESPHYCLVLEFCAGGHLTKLLYDYTVPPEILIDWAIQISKGMHYLHEGSAVSLVHRDLKSSNG